MTTDQIRNAWRNMRKRCLNPLDRHFKDYGGRGITICDRWMTFRNFADDMGKKPTPAHSLDRIDVNGNYEPENCRWATIKEQAYNKRNSVLIEIGGTAYTRKELSALTGIGLTTIAARHIRGYPPELIVSSEPLLYLRRHRPKKTGPHCNNGHEFTPENTFITKEGKRFCRMCRRINSKKAYEKKAGRA